MSNDALVGYLTTSPMFLATVTISQTTGRRSASGFCRRHLRGRPRVPKAAVEPYVLAMPLPTPSGGRVTELLRDARPNVQASVFRVGRPERARGRFSGRRPSRRAHFSATFDEILSHLHFFRPVCAFSASR